MNLLWIAPELNTSADRACLSALRGISVEIANTATAALLVFRNKAFDAVVINTPSEDWSAGELLEQLHRMDSSVPVLIRDESPSLSEVVRLTKLGAFHVVDADADPSECRRLSQLRSTTAVRGGPSGQVRRASGATTWSGAAAQLKMFSR